MKIRIGQVGDIKQIIPLWVSFFKDDVEKDARYYLSKSIENNELLVAEEKNSIAGFLCFDKNLFAESDYIITLIVHPNYQNKGIGSSLVRSCENRSIKRKRRRLFISCEDWNKKAIEFHTSKGFKKCGYIEDMWGEGKKEIIFSKKL